MRRLVSKIITLMSLTLGIVFASSLSTRINQVNASTTNEGAIFNSCEPKKAIETTPTYIDSDILSTSITSNTKTELTNRYNVRFSTAFDIYGSARYTSCKILVVDENFYDDGEEHEEGERPVFDAYLYSLVGASANKDVVIPKTVTYLKHFDLKIIGIRAECVVNADYKNITSIVIPDSVETIEANAFKNVPSGISIQCVSSGEQPGWVSGWNTGEASVSYGYSITATQKARYEGASYTSKSTISNGGTFMLGYYSDVVPELYKPLVLQYDVYKDEVYLETREAQFTLHSKNNWFDSVGTPINENVVDLAISIYTNKGEEIDEHSFVIRNIYKYVKENNVYIPDLTSGEFASYIHEVADQLDLNRFVKISPKRLTNYAGYTEIDVNMDSIPDIYKELKPDVFYEYEEKIKSGVCIERYRITNLYDAKYTITYFNGEKDVVSAVQVASPYTFYNLPKKTNNNVGFLFCDKQVGSNFNFKNIKSIELTDFMITLDLYSYETHDVVNSKASVNTAFGSTTLYSSENKNVSQVDLILVLIIVIISATVLYLIGAVILFFYYKSAYKNDEFRRLKPKQFVKKSIINFIGYAFIVMSATYIVFRWGFMATSIVAFNPLDVFVIIFTVGAAISIGLFIRNLVLAIRANKKRKQSIKLKLDQDVDDDGTK